MPGVMYDSRVPTCKTPFGALRTGQTAHFTIYLPKALGNPNCSLRLFPADQEHQSTLVPMKFSAANLLLNSFCCELAVEAAGLYYYYFEIEVGETILTLKRAQNGEGILGEGGTWQLTVYLASMKAPACLRDGVMYQIFPDRFYNSGTPKKNVPDDRWLRDDWGELPAFQPNEKGEVTNSDYFGGDLAGIEEKLDYIESLGVNVIYLNPIFEAHSNHRYNTADYHKIDPLLGDEESFRHLCSAARERGIAIILDGVFSHTGSDSVYFNKNRRYGNGGAYNDPESPYRSWYQFIQYPERYESWWGFVTLPNVNETEPTYLDFICGENGVVRHWLGCGASGFRLDVADELPDAFLDRLYAAAKSHNPDCAILGEVWEDASNKVAYGQRRRYLLGQQMDSVMNYPFKDALLQYIRFGGGQTLYETVMQILENYPPPVLQVLMNSLSTHDTVRAITALGGEEHRAEDREWQVRRHFLNREQYAWGKRLFCLASILQFGLPGIPSIYYGDEAGLSGYKDPFNRCCYPWGHEDKGLISFIRSLGKMRRDYPIFGEAQFTPLTFSDELCSFVQSGREHSLLFAVNRSDTLQALALPEQFENAEIVVCCGIFDGYALEAQSGVILLANTSKT